MSKEEKKAIEDLKGIDITYFVNGHECANFYLDEADKVSKEIELILNLIEKQQKELKQEKEKNNNLIKQLQEQNTEIQDISRQLRQEKEKKKELEKYKTYYEEMEEVNKKFIAVDKIKELLENETIDISGFRCIAVEDIEELLEEK